MKTSLLTLVTMITFSNLALASEPMLTCRTGMMHGPDYVIDTSMKMGVSSGGWSYTEHLKESPILVKEGKISVQETESFEGEEPVIKTTENEVVRISEASGKFILQIDKKSNSKIDGKFYFSGSVLKSPFNNLFEEEDGPEKLHCYGDADILNFKNE